MALPTVVKTWQFNVNNTEVSASELIWHQTLLYNLKTALIGFASNAWTVLHSSDGTTADATDRWASAANLIWSTGNHSWIIIQNVDGVEVLIDLDYTSANVEDAYIYMSVAAGFTGTTSVSVRPTATDEVDIRTGIDVNNWWAAQTITVANNVWHMFHSTDGKNTMIVGYRSNVPHTFILIGAFQDPAPGQTSPYYGGWYTANNLSLDVTQLASMGLATTPRYSSYHAGEFKMSCAGLGLHINGSVLGTSYGSVAEEIDGDLYFTDLVFFGVTSGWRGPKGKPPDVYWGQYQIASDGDTYPNNASTRQWVQFGAVVLPWTGDSTVPLTA